MEKEMGNRIAKLRGARSQQEVADAIGVRRETVKQWENAERQIKAGDLLKLADYFGVSTDYLVGLTECPAVDDKAKAACEYTGLPPFCVQQLHDLASCDGVGRIVFNNLVSVSCNLMRDLSEAKHA